MKILLLFFCLAFTLLAESARESYRHELSFLMGNSEYGKSRNLGRSTAYALEYQYRGFDFLLKPEIALIYAKSIPVYSTSETTRAATMLLNGVYEIAYTDERPWPSRTLGSRGRGR